MTRPTRVEVRELDFAAYLQTLGYPALALKRTRAPGRFAFVFEMSVAQLNDLRREWSHNGLVKARSYTDHLKALKQWLSWSLS